MPSIQFKHKNPAAPGNVATFSATGNTAAAAVDLAWSITSIPVGFTSFTLKRGATTIATISNSLTRSYQDTGATADTSYTYTIIVNANGLSSSGITANGSWSSAPTVPTTGALTITNSTGGPTLAWNHMPNAATYAVQRSATAVVGGNTVPLFEGPYTTITTVTDTGPGAYGYQDTAATVGIGYFYRVIPVNGSGTNGTPSDTRVGVKTATAGGDAVTIGTLTTGATFNSIDVELAFTGDTDGSSRAYLEFKRSDETTWRQTLEMHRPGKTGAWQNMWLGSVLFCTPGATYNLRITIADAGGVVTTEIATGNQTTRTENLDDFAALAATHYVNVATGSDLNAGTSAALPWRTLDKAWAAAEASTADMVIEFAPGRYTYTMRNYLQTAHVITMRAKYPAVTGSTTRVEANAGQRTVFEPIDGLYGRRALAGTGAWVSQSVTCQPTGASVTVWKWAGGAYAGFADTRLLFAAADINAQPFRIPFWDRKGGDFDPASGAYAASGIFHMGDLAHWADVVTHNDQQNTGFTSFGDGDIYAILPSKYGTPNNFVWDSVAVVSGSWDYLRCYGDSLHFSGIEFRYLTFYWSGRYGVIDHCLGRDMGFLNARDGVVQYNIVTHTGLNSADPTYPGVNWVWVKAALRISGLDSPWYSVGRSSTWYAGNESTALGASGRNTVIRYNSVFGPFNGCYIGDAADYHNSYGFDIHDNSFVDITDDGWEPEGFASNCRFWNNWVQGASVAVSVGPVKYGPLFVIANRIFRSTTENIPVDAVSGAKGIAPLGFKYSGASNPACRIFVINNTFWTDKTLVDGGRQNAGGGSDRERFYHRNNIYRMTDDAFESATMTNRFYWDEDFDHWYTAASGKGMGSYTTLAAYRTATAQGAHSNAVAGFNTSIDAQFTAASSGDLSLAGGSGFRRIGCPIPGIFDLDGVNYITAPDLGWLVPVIGADTTAPSAPTALGGTQGSGKYTLNWTGSASGDVWYENLYRSAAGAGVWVKQNAGRITTHTYVDTTGANGTNYDYAVTAVDFSGNESARSTTHTGGWTDVTAPTAVTSPTATGNIGQIDIGWVASVSADTAYYRVKRATSSGGTYTQVNTNGATVGTTYADTPPDGSVYFYKITAVDGAGNESAASAFVSAAQVPIVFTDTFTGTDGAAWDSTKWTTGVQTGVTAGGASINANRGRMGVNGGAFLTGWALANGASGMPAGTTDQTILQSFTLEAGSGSEQYHAWYLRASGTTGFNVNGYLVHLAPGVNSIRIYKLVAGVATLLASGTLQSLSAGIVYKLRAQITGTTIHARVWAASATEPGTWDVTTTDATYASGFIGMQSTNNGGGLGWSIYHDDLFVIAQ